MDFNHFLSSYLPDPSYGGRRLYADMVEQALQAERLGYKGISIPEHHLVNILLVPSPLQLAVRIATLTHRIDIVTAVAVLPIRDMRVFAGEVVQASALCDGRLILGVGRGAFAYEVARLGTPIETTKHKFQESLAVLDALLTREEVSWDGDYYQFDPITIMPRPESPVPLMIAAMDPGSIYQSARRGYSVQTTPLHASHAVLLEQVNAFRRGSADAKPIGRPARLLLQRGLYCARDPADARCKLELAHAYYRRFDNVFKGPGEVNHGRIGLTPAQTTIEELTRNLMICEAPEMVDRLSAYAEAGVDEVITTVNFGQSQADTLEMMERFAREVMPHVRQLRPAVVA